MLAAAGLTVPREAAIVAELKSRYSGAEVIVIGTVHISQQSADFVRQVIDKIHPDVVIVELCRNRKAIMTPAFHETRKQELTTKDYIQIIKTQGQMGLASVLLSAYIQTMAEKLGAKIGGEFLAAAQGAEAVKANLYFGDRDVRITVARCMASLTAWDKMKILVEMIYEGLFLDKETIESELRRIMANTEEEIAKVFPRLKIPLLVERDQYLAHTIRSVPGRTVVAVVGAGHVEGIRTFWNEQIDVAQLVTIPPKKPSLARYFVPLAGMYVVYRLYRWGAFGRVTRAIF